MTENTHIYQLQAEFLGISQGWSDAIRAAKHSELAYLEAEVDKVQARVDDYIRRHNAASLIQRYYKARYYINKAPLRTKAAIYIQRHYRAHLAYLASKPKPDLNRLASRIQHTFRLYRFRQVVLNSGLFIRTARLMASLALKSSQRAALTLGRRWRNLVQARREKRLALCRVQSARKIQRAFRWFCAFRRRLEAVAKQVQLRWRQKLFRRKAQAERVKEIELRSLEAIKLKNWSDEKYRDIVIRRIQSHWRNVALRKRLEEFQKRRAVAVIQRSHREKKLHELELLRNGAARKLQSAFRAKTGRSEFQHIKNMVRRIQAKWHRFVACRRLKALAQEARDIKQLKTEAAVLRAMINQDSALYLELLVRKCQAMWRGKVSRRQVIRQQLLKDRSNAILKLAAIQQSTELKHIMAAALRIQAAERGRQVRGQLLAVKLIVTRVQAHWRGFIARKRVKRYREEAKALEDLATQSEMLRAMLNNDQELYKELLVRNIQALWRARVKRRQLQAEQAAFHNKAAVKIQGLWRGVRARKEADVLRERQLVERYESAREVEQALERNARKTFNEFTIPGTEVILLPDDVPGLIRNGRFIVGPLKGLFLSDLPAGSLITEEVQIYKTMTDEEVIDVDKVAQVIQTAWRLSRKINQRGGPDKTTNTVLRNWIVRSKSRLMTVLTHVEYNLSLDDALYNSHFVRVEGNTISYLSDRSLTYLPGYGVVVISTPLSMIKEGELECLFFAVTLTDVFPGQFTDGLTLGVTDSLTGQQVPETADGLVGETFIIGFDGHAFARGDFVEIDYNPKALKKGDRVGLMVVYPDGDLLYLVNDEVTAVAEVKIPRKAKFYPVIDLLGSAKQVRLSVHEKPPIIIAEEPSSPIDALQNLLLAVTEKKAEAVGIERITAWISFDRHLFAKDVVRVSEDGLMAEYVGLKTPPDRYIAKGVVLTAKSVPRQGNILFFQLTVLEQVHGFPDGLTVGFWVGPNGDSSEIPETADGLDGDVWVAGFDGQWFSNRLGWGALDWVGNKLRQGDTIGVVVVYPAGDLLILLNGEIVAEAPLQIPQGKDLHGVVDLLGSTNAVRLDVDARPPRIELND